MQPIDLQQLPGDLNEVTTHVYLEPGEVLFHEGDLSQALFAVELGLIKLVHHTACGQVVNHYSVNPGEFFAEGTLFDEVYVCTAIAECQSRVMRLPKQSFLASLRQYPDLSIAFIAQLISRLHTTKMLLALRSIRSARDRVYRYLQMRVQPNQNTITLECPLKEIARDLGLTPEALSRSLKKLEDEGVITRLKRHITFCQ